MVSVQISRPWLVKKKKMSDKVCHPFMTIPNKLAIRAEKKLRVEINKRDKIYE